MRMRAAVRSMQCSVLGFTAVYVLRRSAFVAATQLEVATGAAAQMSIISWVLSAAILESGSP